MDTHHRSNAANPLYPSLDQYNQQQSPPPQHQEHTYNPPAPNNFNPPPNAYNPPPNSYNPPPNSYNPNNFNPSYPQNTGSFYNNAHSYPQPGQQAKQVFDDLGGGLISQVAFGQMGGTLFNSANQYVGKNVGQYLTLSPFKYYFNVNNSYVFNKIKLLLCPFLHKSWKRRIGRYHEVDSYVPPREDINAPDLYIPVMAFVTYILAVGFVLGTNLKFTPEVLGVTASFGLFFIGLEVLLIKAGFYLLNCGNIAITDLVAYCGYKFIGIVVNMFAWMIGGSYAYYALTLYTGISMAIFMVRTLRIVLTLEQGAFGAPGGGMNGMHGGMMGPGMGMGPGNSMGMVPGTADGTMTRNYFLLFVAVMQVFLVYILSFKD